jgi:hypothetical protein
MKMEAPLSRLFAWGLSSSYATSSEARQIASAIEKGFRHLDDSNSLRTAGSAAFDELCSVADECKDRNWDGQGAMPVSHEAYWAAFRFIENLPLDIPEFTVGAEPDGHITLEWYRSPHQTLSISVSPEAELHYAALMGPRRTRSGTEPFLSDVPDAILDLISEVMVPLEKNARNR